MSLAIDLVDGRGFINETRYLRPKKTKVRLYLPFINSKWHFSSCTLLTRLSASTLKAAMLCRLQSNNFSFVLLLKSVNINVLEYKASLNLKFKCVCIAMCSLVISLFSHDFLM